MDRSFWVLLVIAALCEAAIVYAWLDHRDDPPITVPEGTEAEPTREYPDLGFVIASLFPLGLVGIGWTQRYDGFTLGASAIAVIIEAVLFFGWIGSPQREEDKLFWYASVFPAILIVVSLVMHHLQQERA